MTGQKGQRVGYSLESDADTGGGCCEWLMPGDFHSAADAFDIACIIFEEAAAEVTRRCGRTGGITHPAPVPGHNAITDTELLSAFVT